MVTGTIGRACLAALAIAVLTACGPQTPPPADVTPITLDAVRNATVSGIYDKPVVLTDGIYEGLPFEPGAASRPTLRLLADLVRFGDLGGSPGDEAAVLLSENSGGSGTMTYLAVVGRRDGSAASLATMLVGDRVQIRRLSLAGAAIDLDVVEAGPTDPACCPTQLARRTYRFQDGTLALQATQVAGPLSMALALAGPEWTAVEIDGQPLPAGTEPPTATFDAGTSGIAGFGGCNRYTASIKESAPGQIAVGPIGATRMACASPAFEVEIRFFASLGKATQYTFLAGRLALTGTDGDTIRQVLFVRR